MSTLMLQILPIWFAALLLGVPLFVSMGLAALAFAYFGAFPLGIVPLGTANNLARTLGIPDIEVACAASAGASSRNATGR